jgi:exonuclease SbcD
LLCLAIPYLRPADLGEGGMAALHAQAAAVADGICGGLPIIVTGHLHASGGEVSELSERRIVIGGAEAVPVSVFPTHAAYVALGHLHKPQRLCERPLVRYAGSPFPLSLSERDYRHSIVVLELDGEGLHHRLVETPRPVSFLRVPARGAAGPEEVLALLAALEPEECAAGWPYLEVSVALAQPEPGLHAKVAEALAGKPVRLARLERVVAGLPGSLADAARGGAGLADLVAQDVFARMFEQRYGEPPPEELAQAFVELLAEAEAPR